MLYMYSQEFFSLVTTFSFQSVLIYSFLTYRLVVAGWQVQFTTVTVVTLYNSLTEELLVLKSHGHSPAVSLVQRATFLGVHFGWDCCPLAFICFVFLCGSMMGPIQARHRKVPLKVKEYGEGGGGGLGWGDTCGWFKTTSIL